MADIPLPQEPQLFAVGDTLFFARYLPDYLPSNGWTLLYEIAGSGQPFTQFTSVNVGSHFEVTVTPDVTSTWQIGDYVLAGFVELAASGSNPAIRHQIYYGALTLTPGSNINQADITTHNSRMVALIQGQLEVLAANSLLETDVERTRILRERRNDLLKLLGQYEHRRMGEVAQQNLRNGRPSGNAIVPNFNVTGPPLAYLNGVIANP